MKIGFWETAEAYAEHNRREADAIRNHGLRQAKEEYEKELHDPKTRAAWFRMNSGIPEELHDEYWNRQLEWRRNYIKSLERKIRKLERDADKALATA